MREIKDLKICKMNQFGEQEIRSGSNKLGKIKMYCDTNKLDQTGFTEDKYYKINFYSNWGRGYKGYIPNPGPDKGYIEVTYKTFDEALIAFVAQINNFIENLTNNILN